MLTTIPATIRESIQAAELSADVSAHVWEAVVIGAGPAGAVAARELAHQGLSVLLVDKARFPRRKVCGGCLNAAVLMLLEQIGLGDLPRSIRRETDKAVVPGDGRTPGAIAVAWRRRGFSRGVRRRLGGRSGRGRRQILRGVTAAHRLM